MWNKINPNDESIEWMENGVDATGVLCFELCHDKISDCIILNDIFCRVKYKLPKNLKYKAYTLAFKTLIK